MMRNSVCGKELVLFKLAIILMRWLACSMNGCKRTSIWIILESLTQRSFLLEY